MNAPGAMKVNNFGKKFKSYASIVKGDQLKEQNKEETLQSNKTNNKKVIKQKNKTFTL